MFKRKKWKYLILDEAHMIKNWKSQRWQVSGCGRGWVHVPVCVCGLVSVSVCICCACACVCAWVWVWVWVRSSRGRARGCYEGEGVSRGRVLGVASCDRGWGWQVGIKLAGTVGRLGRSTK